MIRATFILILVFTLVLIALPFQLLAMALNSRAQRMIPHLFQRALCALAGVRIREVGQRCATSPTLILSNHVSWLDICVISALTPVVFIAKSEVAGWPVFGWLSKLQRTIFIDRKARHRTGEATKEIGERMLDGDAVVLFAEGTSSDGLRILPFRSALIGAVHHALGNSAHRTVNVQPMAVTYVGFGGVPVGRELRDHVAWYGDADLLPHFLGIFAAGAVDVTVSWGEPVATDLAADRKEIARDAEAAVRRMHGAALRAPSPGRVPTPVAQPARQPMPELA
jgi:1-acyl-sn-glycerol-3-phosphate acyltransferase